VSEELLSVHVKIHRRTRQESYGAKGRRQHDDIVLVLALAALAEAQPGHPCSTERDTIFRYNRPLPLEGGWDIGLLKILPSEAARVSFIL
jgi:hypothetical protein